MSFNIIDAAKKINNSYLTYLKTMFDIKDPEYKKHFEEQLAKEGNFAKGPYLDVIDSFKKGKSVQELINEGVLSKDFNLLSRYKDITLYSHQEKAIRKINENKSIVVSTGTGSGKTECFLMPIINYLMKEKEKAGKLTPGVRALLIYPMNALANDQIIRLRKVLANYPDITFGCYTGQTEKTRKKALDIFKELNKSDENPNPKPLPNELISREEMKENPPHILVSNYAMLEYLILRPEDSIFFDGEFSNHWHFIVLDEAHTYVGSTGIEVSMLLRRVVAKIRMQHIQYILTSATLGSDESQNGKVVAFAENLCNSHFEESDIIRADRVDLTTHITDANKVLSFAFYKEINDLIEKGYDYNYVLKQLPNNSGYNSLEEYLFDLLLADKTYWKIKNYLKTTKSVDELCNFMNCTTDELSAFVSVASIANKYGCKVFDSRYHYFIKATEGFYITLSPTKEVFLRKQNSVTINDIDYKVFEAVVCQYCHSLYLLGTIEENYLVQRSFTSEGINEAFLVGSNINDTDDDDTLVDEDLVVEKYELCPHCGFIRKANAVSKPHCEHNEKEYITLIQVKSSKKTGKVTKCVACESVNNLGVLRPFFTGQEATTSVIGTSLFQQLPSHINKIKVNNNSDDEFGFGEEESETVTKELKAKQFIAFSDNRQAAAYYASYFSTTYENILYSRIINEGIKTLKNKSEFLPVFVNKIIDYFKDNNIHPLLENVENYSTEAWKAVLRELVECKNRNSLIGLGLMNITVDDSTLNGLPKVNLSKEELTTLINVFIFQMFNDAAILHESMSDSDISFFTHNNVECTYELKASKSTKSNIYLKSFIPKEANRLNKRLDYLNRIFDSKKVTLTDELKEKFLDSLWKKMVRSEFIQLKNSKANGYVVNLNKIKINNNTKWYYCSKCKRFTTHNINNVCPNYRCDGTLKEIDPSILLKDNHYYNLFNTLEITPLRIVEHTAQLNRKKAYEYQNLFTQQKLDVLSCSTTFEMGVDVGDLETVFMRNMPPSPTNYSQRAGRAGRSVKSAAFALTFCNKSNHDFNFFNNPAKMIKGVIEPPMFKTDNEKICIRHIYSSALSFFWKSYPSYFADAMTMMESDDKKSGYDLFKNYLDSKPNDLKVYLLNSTPDSLIKKFGIDTFKWVDWLFDSPNDNYPNFSLVSSLYNSEIKMLNDEKERLNKLDKPNGYVLRRLKNYREEDIISFLSKNNILPKYGFPVDSVDLQVPDDLELQLSRDLSMAISEYAPGCQVVANGKLLTSRYIKTIPGKGWKLYDYVSCPTCNALNISVHLDTDKYSIKKCSHCNETFAQKDIKTFLIPEFGFTIDSKKIGKPTLIKPERTYKTDVSFVGYKNELSNENYEIGATTVNVITAANGELAVLNKTDFYVCPICGYAEEKKGKFVNIPTKKCEHYNDRGYKCTNNLLNSYSIGYKFETDIIRINPNIYTDFNSAYSVLQSLILASCRVLNIDNHEIEGCLEQEVSGYRPTFAFILYDKTPGGAGHVKRLNSKDVLEKVFKEAYNIANNCKCGGSDGNSSCYNCLRTYQNQRYHDLIKRKYVIDYFKSISIEN